MRDLTLGFIGGGRIARIFLAAFQNKRYVPSRMVISDPDSGVLESLQRRFPDLNMVLTADSSLAARQDMVFLAVHPPAMEAVLQQIGRHISEKSFIISLAPKFRLEKIAELLGGHPKVVRMIPNAASWMNKGFNPTAFAPGMSGSDKQFLAEFLRIMGEMPEVEEDKLEAYAILTAMGPTYFWFQFNELQRLSQSFGLADGEFKTGFREMVSGTIGLLFDSGLTYEEVVDLIPVKPIGDQESQIQEIYKTKLTVLYQKLKG